MAQLVIAAAGAALGSAFLPGVIGAGVLGSAGIAGWQAGWIGGSLLGSLFTPTQKSAGPRLNDLSVGGSSYGAVVPRIYGHPRIAGQIAWASARREISTTTSQGKGGGGSEYTSYSYEVDLLIVLTDNEMGGCSRVWDDGKLVYTNLTGAGAESLAASDGTNLWQRMTFYTGAATQLPDPTYEAAVGSLYADAYRGRSYVFIQGLQLGESGRLRNLMFEVYASATYSPGARTPWISDADTMLLLRAEGAHGSTTVTDSSSYAHACTMTGGSVSTAEKAVGTSSFDHLTAGGNYITCNLGSEGIFTGDFCVEMWGRAVGNQVVWYFSDTTYLYNGGLHLLGAGPFQLALNTMPLVAAWHHYRLNRQSGTLATWLDGAMVDSMTYTGTVNLSTFYIGYYVPNGNLFYQGHSDEIRVSRVSRGMSAFTPNPSGTSSAALNNGTVQATVTDLCTYSGLSAGQFDASALGAITTPVRAMSVSQVSSVRGALETLAACYYFEATVSDKIYFRPRAAASVVTLAYDDLGWAADGANDADPLLLRIGNELELPAQRALTYWNVDGDYQPDTQYGDRLISGQESTSVVQVPLGLTAGEAKNIVDAYTTDAAVSLLTTSISVGQSLARLEPTDVVLVTDRDASVYRLRLLKRTQTDGVLSFEAVLDDATVFTQVGLTAGGTAPQTVVSAVPDTTLQLLDIPILRDADDLPGFYAAVNGSNTSWHNAGIYESLDNTTYTLNTTLSGQSVIGTCSTTLGNWTGGNVFDGGNTVTVNVGLGQLASYTTADILTGIAPGYLIGSEIVYARTATLVSTGIYTLSDLLRGRRGTEWASTGHAASETFVALSTTGMRYVPLNSSELGKLRYYKGVSAGQRLSAVTAKQITPTGAGLKPFAPVDARVDRSASDHVISWKRRTRLGTRLVGALAISAPLGETIESYEVEIFASSGAATAGTPVLRTITSSTQSCAYTSTQRTADGTGSAVIYMRVYQLSAIVGRGRPLITAS